MELKFTSDQVAALEAEVAYRNSYNAEHNPDNEQVTIEGLVELEIGHLIKGYAEKENARRVDTAINEMKQGNNMLKVG